MDPIPIIDTHLHLIDRRQLSYPWLAGVEKLAADFPYERYAAEAHRCGVTDALHMEVDVAEPDIENETSNVAALVEGGAIIRGAISSCRPENPDFPAFLERALANPLVKGFRRVLHVVDDELSASPLFRDHLRRLGGTERPFDLCVRSDQLDRAIGLVDAAPDVQFVLDHCGIPAISNRDEHPWRERITEIAQRPNVAVKISGVVAYADADTWTVDDLRPYVEHAIGSFGWDRVIWGSDWPVCTLTASLSLWVAATHALTLGCSVTERGKLLCDNARRLWNVGAPQ